jgi:hypothetical protein
MTVMLEVAIGLVFVYLVLSLLSSALAEALEHFFRYRADYLRQGIQKLLLADNASLRDELYAHPLIKSLYTPSRLEGKGRSAGPSYIPSRQFVLALLDTITKGKTLLAGSQPENPVARLLAAIDANKELPLPLVGALRTLIHDAGSDMEKVKGNIHEWFDGSMDRVAGWYKRRAQFVLTVIGIIVAVVINVDTLLIINTLSNDSAVRSAVVTAAETYIRENPQGPTTAANTQEAAGSLDQLTSDVRNSVQTVSKQLGTLGLPIGWRYRDPGGVDKNVAINPPSTYLIENRVWPTSPAEWWDQLASHLLGWLLTAFAVSFGAPFWFDILNKIMVIRSTVKPREKSGEEGSEDRQPPGRAQSVKLEIATAKS